MKKRVIHVELTKESITNALKELENYQKWVEKKTSELLKALADEGIDIMSARFAQAVYDGSNDVKCRIEPEGENKIAVIAYGNATLFIEFGTGIRFRNTHPEASKNGMVRGEYGHRLGRLESGWRYKGEPGTNGEVISSGKHAGEIHTFGNPANKCMYMSIKELEFRFTEIAKRVFQND